MTDWAGGTRILAPRSLVALINHFRGGQILSAPLPGLIKRRAAGMIMGTALRELKKEIEKE